MKVDDAGFALFPRGKNSESLEALRYPGIMLEDKHFKIPVARKYDPVIISRALDIGADKEKTQSDIEESSHAVRTDYLKLPL